MQTHTRPGQGRQKQNPLFSRRYRRPAGKESGAALLIALAILMVLLSLAITFILIVRFESNIARQTFDRTRAEHLLDGAFAQAQYRLNRDLEVHPDAVSLDHGWRSWFSGAAFQEKYWASNPLGAPQVNIEPVESVLRGLLNGGTLYVRFRNDWHTEPLFRGPRTEHWLHVPREQGNMILLFARVEEAELINNVGTLLPLDDLNNALVAAGRPERFERMTEDRIKAQPGIYPFITPAFMKNTAAPAEEGLLPQEVVNTWADVDSDGDGMYDAIWMPLARDINYHGDGIDNDLDGVPDLLIGDMPAFEPAAFVYSAAGLPEAARDEDPDTLRLIRGKFWNDPTRWEDGVFPQGDGLDNDGNGIVDDEGVRLFLTVPLPGLLTQVDVNGDGVFNEKDWYVDAANGFAGPLFVRLPDTLFVPITTGLNTDGTIATGREPVTIGNVDMLDNDADLMVNNFRAYAYIGAAKPGFHDINLDAILQNNRAADLGFYCVTQDGTTQSVPYASVANYFGDPNTPPESRADIDLLKLACSGEPISEITGRYAVNITDEAGKANLNAGGGYTEVHRSINEKYDLFEYNRAANDGASSFEYETRLLPAFGVVRPRRLWGMRTGFDGTSYDTAFEPEFSGDAGMPGYGFVDDNGNALLLSLSGRDVDGDGLVGNGLLTPRLSLNPDTWDNIAEYAANPNYYENPDDRPTRMSELFSDDTSPLGRIEFNQFRDSYLRLGRFQGIDEPGELQLFNPLRNAFAEAVLGEPGRYGDRLLLRKEYLQRVYGIRADTLDFLRNLVTVNSDMRNTYAARGHGLQQAFLRVDPNYATPQQLATALFVRGDTTNIIDQAVVRDKITDLGVHRFAEGLRQFDTAFTGDLMGRRRQLAGNDRYLPGMTFPADPVLQTLRLATETAAARDRSQGRRKLVTENILSSLEAYQKYLGENTFGTVINLPLEALNERERIPARDLMPVGAVQEYLYSSLGLDAMDARVITPDLWWKFFTQDPTTGFAGEDRLFQYATASLDAIRINELMVRPVRRVEAETVVYRYLDTNTPPVERIEQGIYERDATLQPAGYNSNLDPAPYLGMPIFDLLRFGMYDVRSQNDSTVTDPWASVTPMDSTILGFWGLRSAYDYKDSANTVYPQPLLGDRTAYVLETPAVPLDAYTNVQDALIDYMSQFPTDYMPALDIMEFEFRGAAQPDEVNSIDGLPEGRYYLTVNVTDQYGNMTVLDPDVLQYSIKYKKGDAHTGIAEDAAALYNVNDPYSINAVNALFQNVDQPEYLATPAARAKGSAAPEGWVFLPNTALDTDGFDYYMSPYYEDFNATINDFAAWPVSGTPDPTNPTLEEFLIAYPDPDDFITTSDPDGDSVPDIILGIDTAVGQVSWYTPLFQQAVVDWFLTQGFPLPVDVGYPQTLIPITHLTELDDYRVWLDLNGIVYTLDPDAQLLYDALQTYEARFGIVRDYFSNDILKANYPASTNGRTYTVIVPRASSGYRLCVGLRFAAEPRGLFTQALEDWVLGYNAGTIDPSVDFPPPALTYAEYLAFYRAVADSGIVLPAGFSYPPPRLAVNFFDFSQEPDHEYLELVNTSDEEVDVGGWRLEVGVPGPVGVEQNSTIQDPYKSVWRIPDNTKVAAGGHLLLGFDQQDEYRRGDVDKDKESYLIATNGMGLAANETDDALDGITVPPMADESFRMNPAGTGRWYAPLNDGYPANETLGTGSVFQRNDGMDYIDNDGDGLSSAYYFRDPDGNVVNAATNFVTNVVNGLLPGFLEPSYTDNTLIRARYEALDTDRYYEDFKTHSEDGDTIPAWSRIVQLENEYLWLENGRFDPPLYPEKYDPIGSDTVSIRMQDIDDGPQGLTRLARLVLRGGVLPNYPERDGIDNDGDGGYVIKNPGAGVTRFENPNASQTGAVDFFDEPVLQYVPGTLDKDMIDNNLDYVLDERGNEIFNTDDGVFVRHGNPLLSEGVDEGRLGSAIYYVFDVDGDGNIVSGTDTIIPSSFPGFITPGYTLPRFYGHGSYEGTPLQLFNVWNENGAYPTMYRENWIRPVFSENGGPPYYYDEGLTPPFTAANGISARPEDGFEPFITTGGYPDAVNPNIIPGIEPTDSPDWQAFVERRWNPGDNVVVTLYVGHPDLNRVADQVTYRENDVINRTLDDIVPSPYAVDGFSNYGYTAVDGNALPVWLAGSGTLDATDRVCLHPPNLIASGDPGKPTFWLPDHMGLDFYRSLERKHPLYHGDRFGTANRWTVTDGAYDDWADSMSLFQSGLGAVYNSTSNLPGAVGFADNAGDIFGRELRLVYPRFIDRLDADLTTLNAYERSARQLYGHALWGSPLRMNSQARVWENPADLAGLTLGLGTLHLNHNYDRRPGRQFPGLDVYRNTGHKLIQRTADRNESGLTNDFLERRSAVDWALRRAGVRKGPYTAPADLADLPFLSFERVLDGPYNYADTSGLYFPRYAVSPLNTRYFARENDVQILMQDGVGGGANELRRVTATDNIHSFSYGYDPDLTGALASQAVPGGGMSVMRETLAQPDDPPIVAAAMDVSAMNPVVLTVGQARVVPLWPAPPDALNPDTGSAFTEDDYRLFFKWQSDGPPHQWTPVYLMNLPMPSGGTYTAELPWLRVNYPRRIYASPNPPVVHSLAGTLDDPLVQPVYLFNGYYYAAQYFPAMAADIRGGQMNDVNLELAQTLWPRWPVRVVASVVASDYEQRAPSDRAVMYVSKYSSERGEQNRPEALFVWDREAGLENGTYVAYVGTFIPGLAERLAEADDLALKAQEAFDPAEQIPLVHMGSRTSALLALDPTRQEILSQSVPANVTTAVPRFDPHLAFEFMTDRRDAEQMRDYGVARNVAAGVYGMAHPGEWGKEGDPGLDNVARGQVEAADKEGYLLYSAGSGIAWQPIPVRVTDNFLALRVRNTGSPSQVACVTHVVLAPAPRTKGVVNVNTAETHRAVVSGRSGGGNWTVQLFNALMGVPGITNALNPDGNRNFPPYVDEDLGLPEMVIPKADYPNLDPWRQRWISVQENDLLDALWGAAPYAPPTLTYDITPRYYDLAEGDTLPLVTGTELDNYPIADWNNALHGRVVLRMAALLAEGRAEHPDGRYYSSPSELLDGISTGGIARGDSLTGPWPLSNLGVTRDPSALDRVFAGLNRLELHEKRYDEILERFRRMNNMITTRSDVFEIIATVQSGSMSDTNQDGIYDYRGDEFFPQAERRARMIYDRRARAVRQDEKRQ